VIKAIKIEEGSSEEEEDEFSKLKKREGVPVGKVVNEEIEMKEFKAYEMKNRANQLGQGKSDTHRFGEYESEANSEPNAKSIPTNNTQKPDVPKKEFAEDNVNDNFNHYGVVKQNQKNLTDQEKSKEKGYDDLNKIERTAKNKQKELFFKVVEIIYFPFVILWKVTLPEFWVKKNFGIHHIIWGYCVSI